MKKILLIGGTGIISTDISLQAAKNGKIELYILNRGNLPKVVPGNVHSITADINDDKAVKEKIKGLQFDVVADFLSYTIDQLKAKLDIFRGKCEQYIFISSCAAYRPPSEFHLIRENNTPVGNPIWKYGMDKAICERHLAEEHKNNGLNYTIVRPSYTYNDIRILHPYTINHWKSWTMAQRLLDGRPYVLPDDGQHLCTAMHAEDFAKAFLGLCGNPAALQEDFHITSSEYLSWTRIAEYTAEALGVVPEFCFVPTQKLFMEVDKAAGEKVINTACHAAYDNTKIRKAVPDFSCEINFQEGIKRTIQHYQDHPELQKIDEMWDSLFDRILCKFKN